MAFPVALFNASSQSIQFTVNNGRQVSVNGTGPSQNWQPQTQAPGTGPTYSPSYPSQNVLGPGMNLIMAYVNGMPIGDGPFQCPVPTYRQVSSVQIYIFFASMQSATWVVLTDGIISTHQAVSGLAFASNLEGEEVKA
jgi:hypothetical protein